MGDGPIGRAPLGRALLLMLAAMLSTAGCRFDGSGVPVFLQPPNDGAPVADRLATEGTLPPDGPAGGDATADDTGTPADQSIPDLADVGVVTADGLPSGPFGTPQPVATLNSPDSDDDPTLTADMLEIYFDSSRPGGAGQGDIWVATRPSVDAAWSAPVNVVELNTGEAETTPEVAADGLTMYLSSARPDGNSFDIWVSTRKSRQDPWSAPAVISELSSTDGADYAPTPAADLTFMIMSSTRPGAGGFDLYQTSRQQPVHKWQTPTMIGELSTSMVETDPFFDATRTVLYFTTDRSGGKGFWDIWISTRASVTDPWGAPQPVAELNSADNDSDIWLSPDMRTAYLSSNRGGQTDLYLATRD